MEGKTSVKKLFTLGQVALQQLQGWWTVTRLIVFAVGVLAFVYTVLVTANNVTKDVARLQTSMAKVSDRVDTLSVQITTLGAELRQDGKDSKDRDAQMATALVAIYGDTQNGRKIIDLLKLRELTKKP